MSFMWMAKGCLTRRSPSHFLAMSAVPQARLTFFLHVPAGRAVPDNGGMRQALLSGFWLIFPAVTAAQDQPTPPTAPSTAITIYSSAKLDDFDASRLLKGTPAQVPG